MKCSSFPNDNLENICKVFENNKELYSIEMLLRYFDILRNEDNNI